LYSVGILRGETTEKLIPFWQKQKHKNLPETSDEQNGTYTQQIMQRSAPG